MTQERGPRGFERLDRHFGGVTFVTYQTALIATLEVLGSRDDGLLPVVMPVTASPDTLTAVLRSGANPILLDIRPATLQMDPALLGPVLDDLGAAVVILTRPWGSPVDPALLSMTSTLPTVIDSRMAPYAVEYGTFNLMSLESFVGAGALVRHAYTEQIQALKNLRSGPMGLSANVPSLMAETILARVKTPQPQTGFEFRLVPNAKRAVAHLRSAKIPVMLAVEPLHWLVALRDRWVEVPSYPAAEDLAKKLIALPTSAGILDNEQLVLSLLSEVANDT